MVKCFKCQIELPYKNMVCEEFKEKCLECNTKSRYVYICPDCHQQSTKINSTLDTIEIGELYDIGMSHQSDRNPVEFTMVAPTPPPPPNSPVTGTNLDISSLQPVSVIQKTLPTPISSVSDHRQSTCNNTQPVLASTTTSKHGQNTGFSIWGSLVDHLFDNHHGVHLKHHNHHC